MVWSSEAVRLTRLYDGDFKLSTVMILEESPELSEYAGYVAQTVASGFRPRFNVITADTVRKKVNEFLGYASRTSVRVGHDVTPKNIDLVWAEAIKHMLLTLKNEIPKVAPKYSTVLEEITGARSKDLLGDFPAITVARREVPDTASTADTKVTLTSAESGSKKKKDRARKSKSKDSDGEQEKNGKKKKKPSKIKSDNDEKTNTDQSGVETDTETKDKRKKRGKKIKDHNEDASENTKEKGPKTRGKGKGDGERRSSRSILTASLPLDTSIQSRHTLLRKRGEPKLPRLSVVDNSPKDGSNMYVLLQGFYNAAILDALNEIGVRVDGIVLLTKNEVDRKNFGVLDIEENFPGAFQPQNVLPNYLENIERKYEEGSDPVSKFWMDLVKMINKAPPNSYIHDVALLNCKLPPEPPHLDTPHEVGLYSISMVDEIANRIYEMAVLQNWHAGYTDSVAVNHIGDAEISEQYSIYTDYLNRLPAECITLPAIMESMLAHVVDDVEKSLRVRKEKQQEAESDDPARNSGMGSGTLPAGKKGKAAMSALQVVAEGDSKNIGASQVTIKTKKGKHHRRKSLVKTEDKKRAQSGDRRVRKLQKSLPKISTHESLTQVAKALASKIMSAYPLGPEDDEEENFRQKPYAIPPHKYYKPYLGDYYGQKSPVDACTSPAVTQFRGPLYIKTHDFASMRTCHLDEELAAVIAATQVFGDFSGIRNFLWDGIPDFNKGVYMKLHGNLTQFMTFIPSDEVKLKDMFFIIHLLLATGIEIHLQKSAQRAALEDLEENCSPKDSHYFCDAQAKKLRNMLELYEPSKPLVANDDTALDFSHNYLAMADNLEKARILLTPGQDVKFDVTPSQEIPRNRHEIMNEKGQKYLSRMRNSGERLIKSEPTMEGRYLEEEFQEAGEDDVAFLLKPSTTNSASKEQGHDQVLNLPSNGKQNVDQESTSEAKEDGILAPVNAALVATANIVVTAGEIAADGTQRQILDSDGENVYRLPFSKGMGSQKEPPCDNQWLQSAKDLAVLQALVDCPALLALGESGAMDLSDWVGTYLLCRGLQRAAGEGPIVGDLKEWNHAEEMAPIQMIQALSEATQSYLCMERMYCPFYDTILFIFNNPTPQSLKAESSHFTKLNTIVGLQHFLQYTLTDEEVMDYFVQNERMKGLGPVKTLSVDTLMRLIPKDQWVLVPSIKYTLKHRHPNNPDMDTFFGGGGDTTVEVEEVEYDGEAEEDAYEFTMGDLNWKKETKSTVTPRERSRKRRVIDLDDGEPRPDIDGDNASSHQTSSKDDGRKHGKKDSKGGKRGKSQDEPPTDGDAKSKKNKSHKSKSPDSEHSEGKKTKKKQKSKDKSPDVSGKGKSSDDNGRDKRKRSLKSVSDKKGGKRSFKRASLKDSGTELKSSIGKGQLPEEQETPLPLLSPQQESETELVHEQDGKREDGSTREDDLIRTRSASEVKSFKVYDLGKRQLITTSDDYHLFPLDGTVISYNVSTIEPDFRMMQLKVVKNGHESIFYPYYIPHEAELSTESFVLCPYFHSVLSNGIRFAFHDKRAVEDNHYLKYSAVRIFPYPEDSPTFGTKQIVFMSKSDMAMLFNKNRAFEASTEGDDAEGENSLRPSVKPSKSRRGLNSRKGVSEKEIQKKGGKKKKGKKQEGVETGSGVVEESTEESQVADEGKDKKAEAQISDEGKFKKGKKDKKEPKEKLSKDREPKDKDRKVKDLKGREKKKKKDKKDDMPMEKLPMDQEDERKEKYEEEEEEEEEEEDGEYEEEQEEEQMEKERRKEKLGEKTVPDQQKMEAAGQWKYPSSDETDNDDGLHQPSIMTFSFGWKDAKPLLKPFMHDFKITLPSGLLIEFSDVEGPPLQRQIKQTYQSKGSAFSLVETSRYYTMNGSVIRFLTDGSIQTINARGVTTNIRELYAMQPSKGPTENPQEDFEKSPCVKVFAGDIIMPNGDFWHITQGRRVRRQPLFVFTSETMPNGEIFRRRQDGTIYIHRGDGCCIIHYPDGTRFTTRMIVAPDPDSAFSDWVFVGLKYMVEHPNYAPVIFNTFSGNVHVRLPQGEWARVFAEGGVRIIARDGYKIDVDELRATMFCPPIPSVEDAVPNMTVVKLYHSKEFQGPLQAPPPDSLLRTPEGNGPKMPQPKVPETKKPKSKTLELKKSDPVQSNLTEFDGEYEMLGEESGPRKSHVNFKTKSKLEKRQSFAGGATRGLMDQNLRPSPMSPHRSLSNFLTKRDDDDLRDMVEAEGGPKDSIQENVHKKLSTWETKKFELDAFLHFSDVWTMCKAVDSFDNRFAMDIFGNIIVDKSTGYETKPCQAASKVAQELSRAFELSQRDLSGILSTVSSEELVSRAKLMTNLRKNMAAAEACCKRPKTRIFVVKRDLSGYEFVKETTVDRLLRNAKMNTQALVVTDPLPHQPARKFITVMEPVKDSDNPFGVWKNPYREPVFKPRYLCNKDWRLCRAEDLRWFAQILTSAHHRRGQFFISPKHEYLGKKQLEAQAKAEAQRLEEEKIREELEAAELRARQEQAEEKQQEGQHSKTKGKRKSKDDSKNSSELGKKTTTTTTRQSKPSKRNKAEKGNALNEMVTPNQPKLSKKSRKSNSSKEEVTSAGGSINRNSKDRRSDSEGDGKMESSDRSSRGKGKSKTRGKNKTEEHDLPILHPSQSAEVEGEIEEVGEIEATTEAEIRRSKRNLLGYPGDYPSNVPDLRGFYGPEISSNVSPAHHTDVTPPRTAVVVRTIVEIPTMDENLQNTLLVASKFYASSVRAHQKKMEDWGLVDPRTEEEKQVEMRIRREFIEENIQAMHLLEQSGGKLLDLFL